MEEQKDNPFAGLSQDNPPESNPFASLDNSETKEDATKEDETTEELSFEAPPDPPTIPPVIPEPVPDKTAVKPIHELSADQLEQIKSVLKDSGADSMSQIHALGKIKEICNKKEK